MRCHLHYLAGHAEERLTFDMQREIGARMGYADRHAVRGVERFMKHYFLVAKDVGDLTRIFTRCLKPSRGVGAASRGCAGARRIYGAGARSCGFTVEGSG